MILDDLDRYYRLKEAEPGSDIPRAGWSVASVSWEFRLDESGRLISVVSLGTEKNKACQMLVPEQESRSSGIQPYFLCDKAAYFLGLDEKRGSQMREASAELHRKVLCNVNDLAAAAVMKFFDSPFDLESLDQDISDSLARGGLIVFRFLPDMSLVHERKAVTEAWMIARQVNSDGATVQCAITGHEGIPAQKFPMTMGMPGANSSGASLISFNCNAFCSYGHNKDDQAKNASISQEAAFNVGTAIRYLNNSPEHHVDIGDARVVFWTGDDSDESIGLLSLFLDPDAQSREAGEDEKLLASLRQRLDAIRVGRDTVPVSRTSRYFVLGLSPNMARISVRFFQTGTLGSLEDHFAEFLRDIDVSDYKGDSLRPRTLRAYIYQTAAQGKADNVPNTLVCSSVEAMLRGTAFPQSLFEQLIMRMRTDKGFSGSGSKKYDAMYLRVPMLKACLLRKARQVGDVQVERSLTVSLNEKNLNMGYLLGRLFAILEKAQEEAVPGANSTIRDRYIGSASATPARVFPQLLKNGQHHLEKAEYGFLLDRKIQEVMALIDSKEGFPQTLSYDDQGQFFIGYYQQKQALYAKGSADDQEKENA